MRESAQDSNPWSKPTSAATKEATAGQEPFGNTYTFHIDPISSDEEHVLMTTTTQKEIPAKTAAISKLNMEEKSQQENPATINKTTGSPRSVSPGTKPAVRGIEDIWKEPDTTATTTTATTTTTTSTTGTERRRNGKISPPLTSCGLADLFPELSSEDEIDESGLGNGESKAGFIITRRPSMTAELETRIRQARLSDGSDPDKSAGPLSPSTSSNWGVFGMNWNTQNTILGGERTSPPQEQNQPISPLARFQQSAFDPPAPRQVSPANASQGYSSSRSRFPPTQPLDSNQRVQRSQSFSVGDHTGYGSNYLPGQTGPLGHRSSLFDEQGPSAVTRHFKSGGHTGFPASPLARAPIAEEADEFDSTLHQSNSKEDQPARYQDRGRSLSTSAASHAYSRQRMGEGDDAMEETLYEEEEEVASPEFEPLSRSRTLPSENNLSAPMTGLGFTGSRFSGLSTDRERLERQRGTRQSPRLTEDVPPTRRQDSFASSAWDETRVHRSPPRSVDYPGMQSGYESYESGSMVDSPASLHSYPGAREYSVNTDVQNYFNNDNDRRRLAAEQFQYYQMQSRQRHPASYQQSQDPRPFPFHDPDQYTLHFVKFKANRMDVFYLAKEKKLDLKVKDYVIVDGDRGTDLGMVSKVNVTEAEARSLTAQLQREQAAATAANQNGMNANAMEAIAAAANQVQERDVTIPKKYIHRLAVKGEIDGLQMKMQDEAQAKQVCEMKVQQRGLQMDILDVEYQWDRRKLYIYFIAPQRVDFVALVKDLFKIYKTRIWLHNSTASHVTSQLTSQSSYMPPTQQSSQTESQDYNYTSLQPQYDYYRPQRHSPGQQYYTMHQQPMYSGNVGGGYYSPHQQQYFPPSRTYPHPPPPPPSHMSFQPTGPPPPGQW